MEPGPRTAQLAHQPPLTTAALCAAFGRQPARPRELQASAAHNPALLIWRGALPVLANIYLDRLDKYVETVLLPEYTRGVHRSSNPEYKRISSAIRRARKRGDYAAARALQKQAT